MNSTGKSRVLNVIRIPLVALVAAFMFPIQVLAGAGDTRWMSQGKYGIFLHYQYRVLLGYSIKTTPQFPDPSQMTAEQWNRFVDGFDVKGFARQMAEAKVGWVIFCIDDHYFAWPCAPNKAFSEYTGYAPGEKCSRRDLILDLADALNARGVKLICYFAGLNGYMKEPKVLAGLSDATSRGQFNDTSPPSDECRKRRLTILKEYADRYKDKIAGWWFDGMGLDTYQAQPDDWWTIESVVHAANPKAIIAFSYGANEQACLCKGVDDYTGGDTWSKQDLKQLTPQRLPSQEGILWHGKIYCGNIYHGQGDANQFSDQELIDWINTCNRQGGVCTLDWPFDPQTGLLKDFGLAQLKRIALVVKADEQVPQRHAYEPTWESLDQRPVAPWWLDAKFGIYIHWTLASVPGWGNHSSFYWPDLLKSRQMEGNGPRPAKNDIAEEYVGLWQFHVRTYGPDFQFPDFAPMFGAEVFDADRWAEVFARSRAKYVVLTAKHHDGFCLWPSAEASRSLGRAWNAMEVGPRQDLVGKLTEAVRRRGLKMGVYYSFFEWYNPLWLADRARFVREHMQPQLRDLITRYKPDILWADGEWDGPESLWHSRELLTWLFNESPVPEIVVNDRWGQQCRHKHGGFYTTEFTPGMKDGSHPWEENRTTTRPRAYDAEDRPLWYDWVFNRQLTLENYYSARELVLTLVDIVSRGGNLLLNVGPTPDGRLRVVEEERLTQIGDWLKVNGEAIFGTRPWVRSCQWSAGERPKIQYDQEWRIKYDVAAIAGKPREGRAVVEAFFTVKGNTLYAILPWWPSQRVKLQVQNSKLWNSAVFTFMKSNANPWVNVRVLNQIERRMAMLALLVAAQGVAHAQNVARWSWQEPQAKVLPTGDLEWAPTAFQFKVGASVRYIDFDSGNDANDGLSKQTPWKHHPWDPDATGQAKACRGAHTYVFKQGVVYRGQMNANESGTADGPITLTRDPSWGEGPAVICGAEAVTGWRQGADNNLIPEPQKVWYVDLPWAPRNVWMVSKDGTVTRIALARTPNWTITDLDDIQSEWWTWKNPDKPFDNYATINGQQRHLAFDKEDINESKPQDYYEGAIVWTTKGWVMGSPFQARVLAVDRKNGSLVFPCQWGGAPSYKIIRGCRFYLEDKPQYLDSPGEFWFDKKGDGGRLYIRLPGDQDPNTTRIEVAKRIHMIESSGMSHVHIRGLAFRFTNIYWNLTAAPYWVSHESIDVEPGCVRLLGSGTDIEVTHCTFEHVHRGVRLKAVGRQDAIDQVVVKDNVFSDADAGGVELADSTTYGDVAGPMGRLYDVRVMRNKFEHIGIRPDLFGQGGALVVQYAQTVEVAGNMFHRVCAQGIDVHGAKPSGAATDRPFTRILIHHNKVVDSLLNNDDFGGIETWQGGPAYVYDNISGNPGGYRNWDHILSPDTEDRFGHAYYLDGAFKNYYFNNIAWGKSKGPAGKLANTSAFQEIISYQNTFFNNTVYNFVRGSRRQEPQAGRVKFLGNIWQSMGIKVFRDADPAKTKDAGNEAAAGARRNQYAIDTDAYARNVFYDSGESFGVFEPSGRWHKTLESFRNALENYQPLAAEVGTVAQQSPLRDPAAHDFRPSDNSAARGQGARIFVPWSLYETVGEWNFCPIQGDPTRILDEHWCMSAYYTGRDNYYKLPTYPLTGVNITLKDYQNGPLENWTTGALHFNGRDQYAVLANEDVDRTVIMGGQRGAQQRTVSGADLSNPQIYTSNFLIEAYFKTAPGQKDAALIQKMDDAGYALRVNEAGGVTLAAQAAGAKASLASRGAVNDGQWHHVIAEADRKAGTFTIYIDGRQDAGGPGLRANGSLGNDANLYVGGTPQGHSLNGAIDFLRLARGTLVDSKTTIEELYAWEFRGPFLYDFIGHERPADGGEAGAIDEDTLGQGRTATYVVDQAAPGAADTNPGTEAKPFKTVRHAADVAKPGDTVYVMAGKYDERVKVKAGGTEGKLIAFVARPRRSVTVGGFDLEASYICVEGFEITADKPATAVQLHASHCEIVDNYIHDMMAAVSGTVGKPSADGNTRDYSAVAHNRIAYNKVYHCEYGFILGGEDWLVENNEVSRLFMYAPGNKNDDCDYSRFFGKGCIQRYNYYHGSTRPEIKTAHVDCLQTFTNNGEIAMDLLFEYNTCFDFHQMCMVESAPHIGSVRGWTFRHNIISTNSPTMRGGWGPDIIQTLDVTIENCTISTVNWATIGLRGKESTGGLIRNNILCEAERAVDDRMDFSPANPVMEYNLTFKTAPLVGGTNINGKDPLFLDARQRDFRLRQGSPAIRAGQGAVTIGALEYPNVYYVDPRHPGACDDPAWGYPGVPLASLTKACAIAQPGETIILRGGVYREVLAPKNDGVIIRAMQGETVTISGADLIEGWRREVDGSWSAPLATEPKKVLRDSQPWSDFSYDKAAQRITVRTGGDPRLHVFETVVREQGIDLAGKKDMRIEEITVVDTPKANAANP